MTLMPDNDTPLHRLHRLLVGALRTRDPEAMRRPFTVAEIYQDLVPYRRYRGQIGVEMNGDYEHLLLRLLAGEGELVRLESEAALRAIRKELEQANPNTGVYRDYAAADVRLGSEAVASGFEQDVAPAPPVAQAEPDEAVEAAQPAAPTAESGVSGPSACGWCQGDLPDRPELRFCPHCGTDVRVVPCPSCQEPLEPGWHFCIRCGQEVVGG